MICQARAVSWLWLARPCTVLAPLTAIVGTSVLALNDALPIRFPPGLAVGGVGRRGCLGYLVAAGDGWPPAVVLGEIRPAGDTRCAASWSSGRSRGLGGDDL